MRWGITASSTGCTTGTVEDTRLRGQSDLITGFRNSFIQAPVAKGCGQL
ncbi:hypothetical protein DFQ13_10710 [Actinokineospora spheciospongiae]|nr:hypothetical protein DFQ13_10710 [Actinokineospora spheciospongiae]